MTSKQLNIGRQTNSELVIFEQRVRRYQTSLFAYLARMGFPVGVVEGLAQETLLRAWRATHQFDEEKARYSR